MTTIIYAFIISYIATGSGIFLNMFFNMADLTYYNKYLVIIIISVLLFKATSKDYDIKLPGLGWLLTFFTYLIVRSLFNDDNINYELTYGYILKNYLIFVIIINIFKSDADISIFSLMVGIVISLNILCYLINIESFVVNMYKTRVVSELFVDININTISYLAVLMFLSISYCFRNNKSIFNYSVNLSFGMLAMYVIMFNATRGALLISVLAVSFLFIKREKILLSVSLVGIVLILFQLVQSLVPNPEMLFSRISEGIESGDPARQYLTAIAWEVFKQNPLWGKGFEYMFSADGQTNHLFYLTLLVCYGIYGMLLLIAFGIKLFSPRLLLVSRYSMIFIMFIIVYLIFAPPYIFISIVMAFVYNEIRQYNSKINKISY
jgi:hypothetical protein